MDMVQELEKDSDTDYEKQMEEINRALEENALKMLAIEKALTEIDERKIFTLNVQGRAGGADRQRRCAAPSIRKEQDL